MTSRTNNWGEAEVVCLISIWQERSVADILDGKDRNNKAYEIMAHKMKEAGYTTRTAAVIQNKVKALRQAYTRAKVKIYVSLSVIRPVLE